MTRLSWFWIFALCLVTVSAQPVLGQTRYTLTDLGTLGGSSSYATSINDRGEVVGWSKLPSEGNWLDHAFRTSPNRPINPATDDLGPLGGVYSEARAINNSGQVVGIASLIGGVEHAFRTAPDRPIDPFTDDITLVLPGKGSSAGMVNAAFGINASGQVVGVANMGLIGFRAFRTAPNSVVNPATDDLGQPNAVAYGVNDSGQAVGTVGVWNKVIHATDARAFRTAPNSPINPLTDCFGTLGGTESEARGINNQGQVIGWSDTAGDSAIHAFLSAPNGKVNALSDLGTLGGTNSWAWGINEPGHVVGIAETSGDASHAFLYDGTRMIDLNTLIDPTPGWTLTWAYDINNLGQIVGVGLSPSGDHRAFLLTPVPEPSGFAMLLAGLFGVAVAIRARVGHRREARHA